MVRPGGSATSLALWVFVIALIVFAAVFVGWWLIFKPVVPHPVVAALPALIISIVALLLARLLAEKLAETREPGGPPLKPYYYLAYLFLFMVSAMGTVNAAFVLWEGSSVVRQDMAEVRNAYTALEVFSNRVLRSASHERKAEDLNALLANLRVEIDNPNEANYCGVGRDANAILVRIREIVPEMPVIRGTGPIRPCDHARALQVYQAYDTSARATLARDSAFLAFNGPNKAALRDIVTRNLAAMRSSFEHVEGLLSDPTAFARAEVQAPLATAASNFNADYMRVSALAGPADASVPATVDVTQSQELGSFAAFFDIFASRIWNAKTWAYLAIAILLDLALVYFLTQAFVRYRRRGQKQASDPYRQRGPHPKFIWVNPAANPAQMEVRHV